jgi:hypothetical protein
MTDMTAFERQLSGEIADLMGPVRPVDDAAVFAAISETRPARWAIRPTFGATRFVLGAIVVLLGALLLTEVLTRPSDVAQPAASPSARPLPSEEIEPGVSRILVDGFVNRISVGPDGSVWRVDPEDAKSVLPLQGSPAPDAPIEARMIEVGPDGVVWVAGPSGVASWDGLEWTAWSAPPGQQPLAVLPAPDGAALVPWFDEGGGRAEGYANARMGVDILTGDGARDPGEPLTLVVPGGDFDTPNDWYLAFASTSDGDVWAVTPHGARVAAGDDGHLWRWDGRMWHAETGPGADGGIRPYDVAVGPDGSVWLYLADGRWYTDGARLLARLQDDAWTVWTKGDGVPRNAYRPNPLMTVGPDGAVWVPTGACIDPGLAVFDGVTSSTYLTDWCIHDIAAAPDGSIWATGFQTEGADVGLFRVIRVEDDEADPGAEPSPDGSPDMGA